VFSLVSTYFTEAQLERVSAKAELGALLTFSRSPRSPFRERVQRRLETEDEEEDVEEETDEEIKRRLEEFACSKGISPASTDSSASQPGGLSPTHSPASTHSQSRFATPPLRTQLETSPKLIRRWDLDSLPAEDGRSGRGPGAGKPKTEARATPAQENRKDTPRPRPKRCPSIEDFIIDEVFDD
jgi:hypothetical protein